MGVVYKALDQDIGRTVAIKVMLPHLDGQDAGASLRQRFRREAQAAARCLHPNIVAVFDLGREGDRDFIVMEYIEGEELKYFISRGHEFTRAESIYAAVEVLKALEAAHAQGIVHRDIKPGNIILLNSGGVKVADFGVARMDQSELTMTGHLVGTPVYMCPEGLRGQTVDLRADIYSTGMVLLELLTGKKPLPQQIFTDRIGDFLDQTFQSERGRAVQADLQRLLYTALAPEPDDRFPNARTFLRALEKVLEQEQSELTLAETLAASVSEFRPARETEPQAPATFVWTPDLLHKLGIELATYTGPVATVLIRKFSATSQSPMDLIESLAGHISDPGERTRFVNKAKHCMATGSCHGGSTAGSHASAPSGGNASVADTLTPEHASRLVQTLAGHVGPFARQLVQYHARRTYQLSDFYDQLASSIPNLEERRRFLNEINRQ